MLTKELEMLRETEQRCKQLLAEVERESLHMKTEAGREAEREREKFEQAARRDGEALLKKVAGELAAEKQARLAEKEAELAAMWQGGETKVATAAEKLMERMCSGDDCADEPLSDSGAEAG